jgi:hypothetical protein
MKNPPTWKLVAALPVLALAGLGVLAVLAAWHVSAWASEEPAQPGRCRKAGAV